jgi:hypothetical protein
MLKAEPGEAGRSVLKAEAEGWSVLTRWLRQRAVTTEGRNT